MMGEEVHFVAEVGAACELGWARECACGVAGVLVAHEVAGVWQVKMKNEGLDHNIQSQEQSLCNSQVQEAEASGEHSQHHALPPLSICTPPPVPSQYTPAAEASALDDTAIPGGYPW